RSGPPWPRPRARRSGFACGLSDDGHRYAWLCRRQQEAHRAFRRAQPSRLPTRRRRMGLAIFGILSLNARPRTAGGLVMLTLPKPNRYDYSGIGERKDYSWPGGKRLAFCVTTNIEVYAYRKGTGWDPAKKGEPQQQRNYSWRDYGNRVGIWR